MLKFNDHLEEMLKDPEFKKEYDALEVEFTIIQAMDRRQEVHWPDAKRTRRKDGDRAGRHQ